MRTLFEPDNKLFSDTAHKAAREVIYPKMFGTTDLIFETTDLADNDHNRILDGEMGIDRIVFVTVDNLKAPIKFTVQERFRKPQYYSFQDLTVTEWNNNSNLPSELYKINAGLFLYGYFDAQRTNFLDAICISTTDLLLSISLNKIKYTREINKKNQYFLGFRFLDLEKANLIKWRIEPKSIGQMNFQADWIR